MVAAEVDEVVAGAGPDAVADPVGTAAVGPRGVDASEQTVVPWAPVDDVGARESTDHVVTGAGLDPVVATEGDDHVRPRRTVEDVGLDRATIVAGCPSQVTAAATPIAADMGAARHVASRVPTATSPRFPRRLWTEPRS